MQAQKNIHLIIDDLSVVEILPQQYHSADSQEQLHKLAHTPTRLKEDKTQNY